MKKIKIIENKKTSRKDLANPNRNMSFYSKLVKSKAIDLRDNSEIKDLGNGYNEVTPKDKKKLFK